MQKFLSFAAIDGINQSTAKQKAWPALSKPRLFRMQSASESLEFNVHEVFLHCFVLELDQFGSFDAVILGEAVEG